MTPIAFESDVARIKHRQAAYALGRIALGLNIFLHGVVRIPNFDGFSQKLLHQFAQTFLPAGLVQVSAYLIVGGETIIGFFVLIGLGLRTALIAGILLMMFLQFGTAVIQEWDVASQQLLYIGFYAALIAARQYDSFSVDSLRVPKREFHPV